MPVCSGLKGKTLSSPLHITDLPVSGFLSGGRVITDCNASSEKKRGAQRKSTAPSGQPSAHQKVKEHRLLVLFLAVPSSFFSRLSARSGSCPASVLLRWDHSLSRPKSLIWLSLSGSTSPCISGFFSRRTLVRLQDGPRSPSGRDQS